MILSGGLGPTEDDVTREAVAEALGRPLVFRQDLLDALTERFQRLNRKMADNNRRQTFVVEGAEPLPNGRGTAAGQWIEDGNKVVMLLPGPPHELKAMFTGECLPRLQKKLPAQVIRTRFYRVAGMGESDLDQLISPVYKPYANPATTILAGAGDIQIHLRARADTEAEAEALLAAVGPPIEELLGDRIYSRNGANIETVIGEQLRATQRNLERRRKLHRRTARRPHHVRRRQLRLLRRRISYVYRCHEDASARRRSRTARAPHVRQRGMRQGHGRRSRASAPDPPTPSPSPAKQAPKANPARPSAPSSSASPRPDVEPQAKRYVLFGDRNGVRARAAQWALDDLAPHGSAEHF